MLHPGCLYHIYNHGNGDDNLFREEENYRFFLEKYRLHIHPVAETYAWCLMPNHFHLLIRVKSEEELLRAFPKFGTLEKLVAASTLSKSFSNLFSSYTQSFNKLYTRRGSLFQKNFKRIQVEDDDYLRQLILYIHLNPVKHGFTEIAADWKWNSLHSFPEEHSEILKQLFGTTDNYHAALLSKTRAFQASETFTPYLLE